MELNCLCCVCGKNYAQGVYASRIAPVSLAYCNSCMESGADCYDLVVTKVAIFKSKKPEYIIGQRLQAILTATLEITGYTIEKFYQDVEIKVKEFLAKNS
ncbi:hypothetical protein [Lysinibacillus sp. BW-2-10]|uniref:hypothetical protein n=1 Tax=Lysinibacillus sp. BW-2-10 TaxID=2590030 RepID=UPI00117C93BC|nr:hypothetical protein [Lysinibacillus sp. BW-2-10]TSI05294.1 hypothetical protein FJQ64_13400 [Lysinibacillus sp. BW-2-10]